MDQAYVANTRTDGTDYQGKYGGAFLDELKAKYPSIFNRVQISNGKQLPTNEKITKWSAKYFNGTNILGRGINYVLRDDKTNQYFNTSANGQLLPTPLRDTGAITSTQVFHVVDKMFTSYVITKPLRMNLFKMVTVTGITSVVTVR